MQNDRVGTNSLAQGVSYWLLHLCCLWGLSVVLLQPALARSMQNFPQVSIQDADRILRGRIHPATPVSNALTSTSLAGGPSSEILSTSTVTGCASGSTQPLEIATLASSLKCDVDLIFEYVYDNIEYEPIFGSNKGALGTLLDQSGSDIDQAQLFVALLSAAGVTQTNFIYGYITLTGPAVPTSPCATTPVASAPGWFGVKNDGVSILQLIADSGTPNGNYQINSDGTLNCADIAHVWVQVTIGGTNYVFDPSFKQHAVTSGLGNLGSLLGYSKSQFLADVGGTVNSFSISNINRAKLRSDLAAYSNNLISSLMSHIQSGSAPYSVNDVIGGKTIIPLTGSPIRQTSLPYLSHNQPSGYPQNWGAAIPNAYRSCLAISMPGVTQQEPCGSATAQTVVLYSDQTYGERITVFSVPDQNTAGNYIATLLVNGAPPSSGTNVSPSTAQGQNWGITAAITHPYVTTLANQQQTLNVKSGGSYLVSAGWGGVQRGMVQKHQQLLSQALAVPNANPASEAVLGESLAVISYNWIAELTAAAKLNDALAQTTTIYHHDVGITGQSFIQNSGNEGPYVDLPMIVSTNVQQTCWPNTTCPYPVPIIGPFYNNSAISSALESAVLEQTQAPTPNMIAASTVKVVDMNAATGAATYFADGTTTAGQNNYINIIRPAIYPSGGTSSTAYSATDIAFIDTQITGQSPPPANPTPQTSQILLPLNGQVSVGLWKGAGYSVIQQTSDTIDIAQRITGGLSGGFSGQNVPTPDQVENTDTTVQPDPTSVSTPNNSVPATNNSVISEPIDAVSGSEIYNHTDLTIGSGSFPYALPFGRTYTSSSYLNDVGLGNGWTHSYSYSAMVNSDPYEGLGATSPIRTAAAIAATYVAQDLLTNSGQSAQSLTLAWMVDLWLTDQLTNNAVIVNHPDSAEEFVALPGLDGQTSVSYNPPFGSAIALFGAGAGTGLPTNFTYTGKDQSVLYFTEIPGSGSSAPIASWQTPNGLKLSFTYNSSGNLNNVANNLGRSLSLSYNGSHISSVSDGSRVISFGYSGNSLASATDPLGKMTTFGYDSTGFLNQVFYPNAPTNPYFVNYYDGLGRVYQQLNANSQLTSFYFAGSRTETVGALGDRHVTYQTPRRKIIKDFSILSATVGDIFNDTPQQNGLVNLTSTQYDALDRSSLVTAPEGGTTSYGYSPDLRNNIVSVTRTAKPGSTLSPQTTAFSYDPIFNKPTSITDPLGLIASMSYDSGGNLKTLITDFGNPSHFNARYSLTYNGVGQPIATTDALGVVTQYGYDSFGNQISVVRDAGAGHLNQQRLLSYNALGDVTSMTDPNGNVTTSTYDAARRLTSTTSPATSAAPNGLVTSLTYDSVGQLLQTQQSANGAVLRTISSTYTSTGKISSSTDPNGNVTTFAYDALDRLLRRTDPMGRVTGYGYDPLGRQVSISNPAIQSGPLVQQAYTPDGLLSGLTDASGHSTNFAYDGFDRLSTTTYPDNSTEVLAYDADGNILSSQTRAGATIGYTYDTLNRLSTKSPPSPAAVVSYGYDLAGHATNISDNSAAITPPAAGAVATMTYTYDAMNHLTATSFSPVQAQAPPSVGSASFSFAYNSDNQRIGQLATDNSFWAYPTSTPSNVSYTANNLNQYTAIGSVTPTYDGNGNLTYDGTFTYGYDAENRLISASGAGVAASYAYDAQGRRKSKTVNGATTIFVQDPQARALLDYNGANGAVQNWYAVGSGSNDVLAQINLTGSTRATYLPDIQGSVIASLDANSGVLSKTGYQPYGESPTTSGTFRYTGARIDAETNGLYDFRARMYSPLLGRFMQTDPIGYQGGVNLYAYVNNDPLNLLDPFGLDAQFSLGVSGTLAILFGGVGGSFSVGVSVPDRLSNLGGYQVFATLQGNAMGGVGLYGGAGLTGGISGSQGPLQPGLSGSKGIYIEGDIGSGISAGASVQGNSNGGSIGFSPAPHIGLGYGAWFGTGGFASGTVATPTFGQIYNGLSSLICSSCSNTNAGVSNSSAISGAAGLETNVATPDVGPDAGTTTNAPRGDAPGK